MIKKYRFIICIAFSMFFVGVWLLKYYAISMFFKYGFIAAEEGKINQSIRYLIPAAWLGNRTSITIVMDAAAVLYDLPQAEDEISFWLQRIPAEERSDELKYIIGRLKEGGFAPPNPVRASELEKRLENKLK